jgi:hypothetical protein
MAYTQYIYAFALQRCVLPYRLRRQAVQDGEKWGGVKALRAVQINAFAICAGVFLNSR